MERIDHQQEELKLNNLEDTDDSLWPTNFFQEPTSFRPKSPDQPKIIQHITSTGKSLNIKLVNSHPLWGHVLYPASIILSRYIEENSTQLFPINSFTRVLELGAGAGLPGLTSILSGADCVVTTDFPDPDLINNLEWNADQNLPSSLRQNLIVRGLKWGNKLDDDIFDKIHSNPNNKTSYELARSDNCFDLILLSDLVFNHSEHNSLLKTCEASICSSNIDTNRTPPSLLVFYSHHRPWCVAADLEFFVIARKRGWKCHEIIQDETAGLAFPADKGDAKIRGTVHGWILTR